MKPAIDVWVYRNDSDATRYLLLRTSQEKADKWFSGGRFWQIPTDFIDDGKPIVQAAARCLGSFGVEAVSLWAAEHTYTIYNRRYEEIQVIVVLAAHVDGDVPVRLSWEHSEHRWCTAAECEGLLGFRGLKEGLASVRSYVTEIASPLAELRLR